MMDDLENEGQAKLNDEIRRLRALQARQVAVLEDCLETPAQVQQMVRRALELSDEIVALARLTDDDAFGRETIKEQVEIKTMLSEVVTRFGFARKAKPFKKPVSRLILPGDPGYTPPR